MPKNAGLNADGFRFYPWPGGDTPLNRKYNAVESSDLLSVTSIKTLAGEQYPLVNWKLGNVVNLAMGTRTIVKIGPRGGVNKVLVKDGPFPGEFVRRMIEHDGNDLDEIRKWLRATADEPRDIAAVRGSVVHKMIEQGIPLDLVDEDLIRKRFAAQWAEERRKVKPDVIEDDVNFVANAMAQYADMREDVPFVVIAQEPQVYNLTAGYGGSGDVILWFLGHFEKRGDEVVFVPIEDAAALMPKLQKLADKRTLTLAQIEAVGGTLGVGDWKTSVGVYTSHIIQIMAYMAGEFIALDGIIDERLSDILAATALGVVVHIRPNKWAVDIFSFEERRDALRAFLGSLAYARFLAMHKHPAPLFMYALTGQADGTDKLEEVDDGD